MRRFAKLDRRRFPTLHSVGVAAEDFADFIHTRARQHQLDVVLFSCVVAGTGVHQMGDKALLVGPGSVGITHYGQTHDLLTDRAGMSVINLYLDLQSYPLPVVPSPWDRTLASMLAPHPSVIHQRNQRVHFAFDEPQRMEQPLRWMLREQRERSPGYEAVMQQLLAVFLVECCRVADRMGLTPESDAPGWVEDLRVFLDSNFDRPIGLSDLTRRAGVSAEHICRCFRQHTGLSPIAYLNDRRLQSAMWLLRTTNRAVTDIAVTSGFADIGYFNRKFKESTGQTPTAFRRRDD